MTDRTDIRRSRGRSRNPSLFSVAVICAAAFAWLTSAAGPAVASPKTKRQIQRLTKKYEKLLARYKKLADHRASLLNIISTLKYAGAVTSHDLAAYRRALAGVRRVPEILDFFVSSNATSFPAAKRLRGRLNPSGTAVWLHLRFIRGQVYRRTPYTVKFDLLDSTTGSRRYGTYGPTSRRVNKAEEKIPLLLGKFSVPAGRYMLRATVRIGRSVLRRNIYVTLTTAFLNLQNRVLRTPIYPAPAPRPRPRPLTRPRPGPFPYED